jgi:hypothetical protein
LILCCILLLWRALLCRAVLCRAVLHPADVAGLAVPCCAVLRFAVLHPAAVARLAVLWSWAAVCCRWRRGGPVLSLRFCPAAETVLHYEVGA